MKYLYIFHLFVKKLDLKKEIYTSDFSYVLQGTAEYSAVFSYWHSS
jgi:hypothetical protein